MPIIETEREAPSSKEPQVRLLTYVLSYDNLADLCSKTYWLDDQVREVPIGRAAEDSLSGWTPAGGLRILDRWLSGRHALITCLREADVIRDLGSVNGTYVNGVQIAEQELSDCALIEVGHSLLCYRRVDAHLAQALEGLDPELRFGPAQTHCPEVALLLRNLGRIAPSRESVLRARSKINQ